MANNMWYAMFGRCVAATLCFLVLAGLALTCRPGFETHQKSPTRFTGYPVHR